MAKKRLYGFQFGATLNRVGFVDTTKSSLTLHLSSLGTNVILSDDEGKELKDSVFLRIHGSGLASEEQASEVAHRCYHCLLVSITYARRGLISGISSQKAYPRGLDSRAVKRIWNTGLIIYPDRNVPKNTIIETTGGRSYDTTGRFTQDFAYFDQSGIILNEKQTFLLELLSASYFEATAEARLLSLITLIEASSKRSKRSERARCYIDRFIEAIGNSGLSTSEINPLKSALGDLKNNSLKSASEDTVQKFGGDKSILNQAYRIRHELVHSGKSKKPAFEIVSKLEEIAIKICLRSLGLSCHIST